MIIINVVERHAATLVGQVSVLPMDNCEDQKVSLEVGPAACRSNSPYFPGYLLSEVIRVP